MPAPPDGEGVELSTADVDLTADEASRPPARVESILSGAAVAFSQDGFAATSMRQIAASTDTSLGAIYYHFESKESILRAIITTNFQRVQESLADRLEGVDAPREAFEVFVANHIEFFGRHLDEMRVMAHELDTLTGEAGEEIAALRRSYTERARGILSALRPNVSPEELDVSVLCLFGMLNWTYRWFHTIDPTLGPVRLAARMSDLFLDGYLNDRGAE